LLATSISDSFDSTSVSLSEPVFETVVEPEEVSVLPLLPEPPLFELVVVDPVLLEPEVEPVLLEPVLVVVLFEPTQLPL
jgi:hypothetical protein